MGSIKIILCFSIVTLFNTTEAVYCSITERISNCEYTVICTNKTSSVTVPSCSYNSNVKFVITNSNVFYFNGGFFGSTNFDSKVRTIVAKSNNWTNIDTRTFTYYKEATTIDLSKNHVKYIKSQAFRQLIKLATLNLSSNIIESLDLDTFYVADGKPLNLQLLDLSYNRLTHLSTELSQLANLTTLYMQGNSLHNLDSQCFFGLKSLQELNIALNELITLNTSLINLKNLTRLNICYNYLRELLSDDTISLISLQYFNASHNNIRSIQYDCFKNALNIEIIDFSFNNIIAPIKSEMFKFNTNLQYVDFYNNSIPVLGENVFSNDARVNYLNLEKNNLEGALTARTFVGLKNIIQFDLANQRITTIKDNAFEDMTKLQYLNLTRNKISGIANSSFVNTSITKLDLSYNRISTLHFLKDLSSLIELYLNNNNLSIVPRLTFFGQNKLKVLDLSMNMIVTFEELSLPLVELQYLNITGNRLTGAVQKNIFSPAKFLRFLDVSNFNITIIEAMAFANLPNLARLNLSHNHIDFIEPNNFIGVNNMYSLDISNNCLKQLAFNSNVLSNLKAAYLNNNDLTNVSVIFPNASKLIFLELSNNKIQNLKGVSANMFPNITVLRLSNNQIVNFNNPDTNTLTSLVDLQLSSNNLSDITLRYFKELMTLDLSNNSFTRINKSFFENVDYIQALDLSQNNISDLQPGTFQNMRNLKLLNLSSNYLTQLHYGSLRGLHKTELLDLSKNKIFFLEIDVLHECDKLNTLILDYNFLTTLDVVTLTDKYLFNLKTLSIGGNPISCREVVLNTRYARRNHVEVTAIDKVYHEDNVHGIKCGNDTSSATEISTTEDASYSAFYFTIITLVTFSITISLAAIIVVVYMKVFRNRRFASISHRSMVSSLEMNRTDMSNQYLI